MYVPHSYYCHCVRTVQYAKQPALYAQHPPTFLAQIRSRDDNADLCASRNYHETLTKFGVKSVLMRPDADHEACYCVGHPGDAAAEGSPFAPLCSSNWKLGQTGCYTHLAAFAGMIEPLADFLVKTLEIK